MAKEPEDKLLDHNYDGILEYDNPLPPWWVALFIICVIWAAGYLMYYHVAGIGPSQSEEFAMEYQEYEQKQAELMAANAGKGPEFDENMVALDDEQSLAAGNKIFIEKCAACHGQSGEGMVGPNFADDYWIHGNRMVDVVKVIHQGVPSKGMISWKALLSKDEIEQVASYILTLHGTNPANPKAPQGDKYDY